MFRRVLPMHVCALHCSLLGGLLAALPGCWPQTVDPPPSDVVGGVEMLTSAQGFTLHVPPFSVPPGTEIQDCYFFVVPDLNQGQPIWVNRFKLGQRTGSHHMNVFRVKTVVNLIGTPGEVVHGGECRVSPNWADWPLVVNTQESNTESPIVDWKLPADVAQRFEPGELLMVQTHYVNADLQTTPDGGEVRVNFYKSDVDNPIEMGTLFATQQTIRICQSNPNPTFSGACSFPGNEQTHLVALNGHFHSRGTRFAVYPWDGQSLEPPAEDSLIYESRDWAEPPMAIGMDEVIPAGGGVWWNCEYQWEDPPAGCDFINSRDPEQAGDCCYTFGGIVETGEHCNLFAYYWPKVESDVFCQ